MLNRTALTVFLYASFLYFLKRIVFVKRHVWFFRIYVQLATYDIDGQKGIFVPGSETRNAAKDAAGTVSESMGNSVSFARSAGQQVVMDLTRGVMQGGTRLIAGRVRAVKVTLKAGYKVLLVTKKQ